MESFTALALVLGSISLGAAAVCLYFVLKFRTRYEDLLFYAFIQPALGKPVKPVEELEGLDEELEEILSPEPKSEPKSEPNLTMDDILSTAKGRLHSVPELNFELITREYPLCEKWAENFQDKGVDVKFTPRTDFMGCRNHPVIRFNPDPDKPRGTREPALYNCMQDWVLAVVTGEAPPFAKIHNTHNDYKRNTGRMSKAICDVRDRLGIDRLSMSYTMTHPIGSHELIECCLRGPIIWEAHFTRKLKRSNRG